MRVQRPAPHRYHSHQGDQDLERHRCSSGGGPQTGGHPRKDLSELSGVSRPRPRWGGRSAKIRTKRPELPKSSAAGRCSNSCARIKAPTCAWPGSTGARQVCSAFDPRESRLGNLNHLAFDGAIDAPRFFSSLHKAHDLGLRSHLFGLGQKSASQIRLALTRHFIDCLAQINSTYYNRSYPSRNHRHAGGHTSCSYPHI